MNQSIFEFSDYKHYLNQRLSGNGALRGIRSRLAEALKCRSAYISQVLNSTTHFSLEHAALINQFLGHTDTEGDFFLLLVHHSRAGSGLLKAHYQKQMQKMIRQYDSIRERIHVEPVIAQQDQSIYYSTWYYSAIHMMLLIPKYHQAEAIAEYLHLPLKLVAEVIEFLTNTGLVEKRGNKIFVSTNRLHLASDSRMIACHHSNWRQYSLRVLDKTTANDLRYSGPVAISQKNARLIKSTLLKTVESVEPLLAEPGEEVVYGLGIDFFAL